jgi:hypothetical protein
MEPDEQGNDTDPISITPKQASELASHLRAQNLRISESFAKAIFETDLAPSLGRFVAEATAGLLKNFEPFITSATETFRASLPDNWKGFKSVREIGQIFDVMESTGWCLAWVPREEIVRGVVDEPRFEGRAFMLLARRNEITADIRDLLRNLEAADLSQYKSSALKATLAYSGGHPEAAQALAASTMSALIQDVLDYRTFGEARQSLKGDPRDAGLGTFRRAAVFNQVALSLQRYFVDRGDEVPGTFSRHATAHSVSPRQFTEINCLSSLLLVAAFLRELELSIKDSDLSQGDC